MEEILLQESKKEKKIMEEILLQESKKKNLLMILIFAKKNPDLNLKKSKLKKKKLQNETRIEFISPLISRLLLFPSRNADEFLSRNFHRKRTKR